MNYLSRKAEFERAPAPAEVLPLLLARRALYRWEAARADASWAAEEVLAAPGDDRLARCWFAARADIETLAGAASRAVLSLVGEGRGPVYLDCEAGRLRIDRGQGEASPRLMVIGPDDPEPPTSAQVFDLVAAERDLIRRSIRSVVLDEAHLARALAQVEREETSISGDSLGRHLGGGHTPWSLAWIAASTSEAVV